MGKLVIHSPLTARGLRYISTGFVAEDHRSTFALRSGVSGDTPSRSFASHGREPWSDGESSRKPLLPVYSSHPANLGLHASSQSERFSFATHRSLKSPVFWAFFNFWSWIAALSPFLPRAGFPNVASVKTVFSTANYRALWLISGCLLQRRLLPTHRTHPQTSRPPG